MHLGGDDREHFAFNQISAAVHICGNGAVYSILLSLCTRNVGFVCSAG